MCNRLFGKKQNNKIWSGGWDRKLVFIIFFQQERFYNCAYKYIYIFTSTFHYKFFIFPSFHTFSNIRRKTTNKNFSWKPFNPVNALRAWWRSWRAWYICNSLIQRAVITWTILHYKRHFSWDWRWKRGVGGVGENQ